MRFEISIFLGMIIVGLIAKRLEWRGTFYLLLFVATWIFVNWKKG